MQQYLDQFATSEAHLLGKLEGLTPEQFTFQSAPNRWSIADVVEHVITVENRIAKGMTRSLSQAAPAEYPDLSGKDATIRTLVVDRTRTLEAPEPLRPTGKFTNVLEAAQHFSDTRARTILLAATEANLRAYSMPHPVFGDLDFHQWMIAIALHGDRHAAQIEEIKKDPAFPNA